MVIQSADFVTLRSSEAENYALADCAKDDLLSGDSRVSSSGIAENEG